MSQILKIEGLRKEYKDFSLKDISFTLDRGYIMGFIGPNGSGKSTTIKLIMNLIHRDRGEISIFGLDHLKNENEVKQRIGFIYDENHFYDELTLKQMKNVMSRFYINWNDKLYSKYMKQFHLKEDKKIKELSKGMQMKFSLVLALSHDAELILMDEPTSGLDPVFRSELLDILMDIIQNENKSIFFSTHITTDLEKVADYITFIHDGRIIFSKTKDEVLDHYGVVKGGRESFTEDMKKNLIGIKKNKFNFEALTPDANLFKSTYGEEVVIERPTLDDIMLFTVKGMDTNE